MPGLAQSKNKVTKVVFILLLVGLPNTGEAAIDNLQYCGMRKGEGHLKCYRTINHCWLYTIPGTCRAQRVHRNGDKYWCLYANKSVLWGCYSQKEKCEIHLSKSPLYGCFEVN